VPNASFGVLVRKRNPDPLERFARLSGFFFVFILAASGFGCRVVERTELAAEQEPSPAKVLDGLAEKYVKLVLALGEHDPDYVDAYYGPPQWREQVKAEKKSAAAVKDAALPVIAKLEGLDLSGQEEMIRLRRDYLLRQLRALVARVDILAGKKMTFDQESKALYDVVAPSYPEGHFRGILDKLDRALPGKGPLAERYEKFKRGFVIPREKVDTVFQAAIREARRRTLEHLQLPEKESFTVEYVTGKSWSGYNWYQGDARSLIQINTDLPVFIDRAVDLAAHEGYPGHHVYNVLLEQHLVRERGWQEFTVYPLFSPQSMIAEGSANFGIEVAFPGEERLRFERETLFPLAGLDPRHAGAYHQVLDLVQALDYARNEAARRYLDGAIDAAQAAEWLTRFAMMLPEQARQRVRFMDQYRSYVINYNLGKDLVRAYIERRGGTESQPQKRWEEFAKLLSSPRLPSSLD
jgi:hypothetical protein